MVARVALACGVAMSSTSAIASASQPGLVANTIANHSGRFFFETAGQRTTRPGCAYYPRWVVDASTPAGQAVMALVLTAQGQGKLLLVQGLDDCRDWPDTEAVSHVQVVN